MAEYNHKTIEQKWRKRWYDDNIYEAVDFSPKPKKYILAELPYPSGPYLHAGHMMRYTVPDVLARYYRLKGFNVMFPMGWDAFGLPTEGYAIKANKTPQEVMAELSVAYKNSFMDMGYNIDWNREINTCDPKMYKWTQWLFLKFYENGLAEKKAMPVWWCKELGVLADEEVLTDKEGNKYSERGSHKVERKMLEQWVLKIPAYAEKLLSGLDQTDFPQYIKTAQINWIGKSVGAEVDFKVENSPDLVKIFTTRIDTIYGATFLVISPEHPLAEKLITEENSATAHAYILQAKQKSDFERTELAKQKTGVFTGSYAINPFSNQKVPIWIGDFVVMTYGTGAIMGVPAHDERDHEFATKFDLPVVQVIKGDGTETLPFTQPGTVVNSGPYSDKPNTQVQQEMYSKIEKDGIGKQTTNYKMRDWVYTRQRYWGEPVPLVYKQNGEVEAVVKTDDAAGVAEKLPITLPPLKDFVPGADGQSPLAHVDEWVNTTDSQGNPAKRETQTMPTWAGSCWYYIRYIDPNNDNAFADYDKLKYWLPVDKYFGDGGHTTVHLLYSRFWHKFFYDLGLVPTPEPYNWRMTGGLLLGPDGRKMSKSIGNVVNPKDVVDQFGADAARVYLCFIGPYDEVYPWNDSGIKACHKFLKNFYELSEKVSVGEPTDADLERTIHKLIKTIGEMYENLKMNTAVSEFMKFVGLAKNAKNINVEDWKSVIKLLAPIAPFVAEDLWYSANGWSVDDWAKDKSVHLQNWPEFEASKTKDALCKIAVQVNGKVRGLLEVGSDESEESVVAKAKAVEGVAKYLDGFEVKRVVYVGGKILSFLVGSH